MNRALFPVLLVTAALSSLAAAAEAQFRDDFVESPLPTDPLGIRGWSFFTGDGEATMDMRSDGAGHARVTVDATRDRRGIWWALVKRCVPGSLDLARLARPGQELRIEARVRVSHAPRRVNLHLNTQRTTDFHSHLMEFDIPETARWHTISMTTRDFDGRPGDRVCGQLALIDWGPARYEVEIDHFRIDVVDAATAGPDLGEPLPYRPPIPDPAGFAHSLAAVEAAVVDLAQPDVNLRGWGIARGERREPLLTVGGTQWVILRFDLAPYAGRRVTRAGLLELTTHSVLRAATELEEFGVVRVVEILGGDPAWSETSVSFDGLRQGRPIDEVFNSQMIIDVPVAEASGARTHVTISRPVLQRLVDRRTLGIALRPLGSIVASFERGAGSPRLLLDMAR